MSDDEYWIKMVHFFLFSYEIFVLEHLNKEIE